MLSVGVSRIGKTRVVLIDSGAKVNSSYYCNIVLEKGLMPAIRAICRHYRTLQQDGAPAHTTRTAYLYFLPVWDDYSPEAGLMHINELKFSLYGGAACYQSSRLAEQSLNSMQHQQQQPVEKLLLLLKQ